MSGKIDLDMLKFAKQVLNTRNTVTIDSSVYHHYDYTGAELDLRHDIHILRNINKHGITMQDIIDVFEKINEQLEDPRLYGHAYFYEGLTYNKYTRKCEIHWGS